jgi:CubicO group peptidase (beta-lactamase class C family)
VPEISYAVVASDQTIEIKASGVKKINSDLVADLTDQFRIGSNTKTVTSYIAALLVKQNKIKWETKFFDLYPEIKAQSNPAFHEITLQDLITMRVKLVKFTYANTKPDNNEIKGNEITQRYLFASWALRQDTIAENRSFNFSNPSYVLAGMMLEKASKKDYKFLVKELGDHLKVDFNFGQPNFTDRYQTWGHDANLEPEFPATNYKLFWLCASGNIHTTLPDYVKFIQMQLNGLKGGSPHFTEEEFEYFHFGLPEFSFGWYWFTHHKSKLRYSYQTGNPGTFLTEVHICKELDRALIVFTNAQTKQSKRALMLIFEEFNKRNSVMYETLYPK